MLRLNYLSFELRLVVVARFPLVISVLWNCLELLLSNVSACYRKAGNRPIPAVQCTEDLTHSCTTLKQTMHPDKRSKRGNYSNDAWLVIVSLSKIYSTIDFFCDSIGVLTVNSRLPPNFKRCAVGREETSRQ